MDEPVWVPPHERPPLVASARMLQPFRVGPPPDDCQPRRRVAWSRPDSASSREEHSRRLHTPRATGMKLIDSISPAPRDGLRGGAPGRPPRSGDPVTALDRVVPRRYDARTNMRRDGNVRPSSVMNGAEHSSTWERTASRSSSGRPRTMIASGPAISVLTSQYR